jgi:hypothetical protein
MAMIELRRIDRTNSASTYLSRFAENVTSQYGEDGIIRRIFEIVGFDNSWCVDVGAWDGVHLSNTWDLINKRGWKSVLIEVDSEKFSELKELHKDRYDEVFVRHGVVGWEYPQTLDNYLASTPIPESFDLLCIDIDGNDWHVWNALTDYRPRVVVIEFNPTAGNELCFVQDADHEVHQGASLLALIDLAHAKGYELVATTMVNALFVRKEEFEKFGIADNSIDSMHATSLDIQILQGYDGTIIADGHMLLNWHRIPLTQEDLQVLPEALRHFTELPAG